MNKFLLAALFGSAALAGPGYAQTAPQNAPTPGDAPPPRQQQQRGMMAMMMRADTNHDGVISREEAIAAVDEQFAQLDTNHDGKIKHDELARLGAGGDPRGAMMVRALERADANGDGTITREEFRAQAMQRFDRLDTNHDGKVDQAEIAAMPMRGPRGGGAPRGAPPADGSQ